MKLGGFVKDSKIDHRSKTMISHHCMDLIKQCRSKPLPRTYKRHTMESND